MTASSIDYNVSKWINELLDKHKGDEPSFSVHFHEAHWSINNSAASQFLYGSPISSILDDVRAFRIPTDFLDLFDKSCVRFFEGCLIVALYDHRIRVKTNGSTVPVETAAEPQRVVLQPTPETLYADIKTLVEADRLQGRLWSDEQALEFESEILLATSQPLCLDPDISVTRIANRTLRASTPSVPRSLKRKRGESLDESGEDEFKKAQKAKLMQFMNPRSGRTFNPRLTDNHINFGTVREQLGQQTDRKPPGASAQSQAPRQTTPLAINTGVSRASSIPSAKGSVSGKPDDKKKPNLTANLNAVMMKKGLNTKGVEASPASASTSLPSASEERPKVIIKLPSQASMASAVKKEEPAPRVSTPVPASQQPNSGRVPTPVHQQARTQTPAPSQTPVPSSVSQAAAQVAPPAPQTTGITFQPGQLPEAYLRAPPGAKNTAGGPTAPALAAGKRPPTQQQLMMAAAAVAAKGGSPNPAGQSARPAGAVAGPNGVPMFPPYAAQQAFLQMNQAHAAAAGGGRGMPMPGNRFSGALQMPRPGAPGVVPMPPNPMAGGADGANQLTAAQRQAQAQMHAMMIQQGGAARAAMAANPAAYQQWLLAATGRGMGRGQVNQQALLQMQAQALQMQALRAQHLQQQRAGAAAAPPGAPKPPDAR